MCYSYELGLLFLHKMQIHTFIVLKRQVVLVCSLWVCKCSWQENTNAFATKGCTYVQYFHDQQYFKTQ